MATLTPQTLIDEAACSDQVKLFRSRFRSLFGDSVEVTPEACEKVAAQFDFELAARILLTGSAWAEYERVRDSAWAEYDRICDSAWAEYKRICARAFGAAYCGAAHE
jgi:hypothetical protein